MTFPRLLLPCSAQASAPPNPPGLPSPSPLPHDTYGRCDVPPSPREPCSSLKIEAVSFRRGAAPNWESYLAVSSSSSSSTALEVQVLSSSPRQRGASPSDSGSLSSPRSASESSNQGDELSEASTPRAAAGARGTCKPALTWTESRNHPLSSTGMTPARAVAVQCTPAASMEARGTPSAAGSKPPSLPEPHRFPPLYPVAGSLGGGGQKRPEDRSSALGLATPSCLVEGGPEFPLSWEGPSPGAAPDAARRAGPRGIQRAPSCEGPLSPARRRCRRRRGASFSEGFLPLGSDSSSSLGGYSDSLVRDSSSSLVSSHSSTAIKGISTLESVGLAFAEEALMFEPGFRAGALAAADLALGPFASGPRPGSTSHQSRQPAMCVSLDRQQLSQRASGSAAFPVSRSVDSRCAVAWVSPGREAGDARHPSPEPPTGSPVATRLPSLSRLRLASCEPEGPPVHTEGTPEGVEAAPPEAPPLSQLPPAISTSAVGPSTGSSPNAKGARARAAKARCVQACPSSSSLKRKRPPMLEIPLKESFTASPASTPTPAEEAGTVEDVVESGADGPGYAVFCKRGRRRAVMEDRFQAVTGLGGDANLSYFGVFDGHGGTAAADFASQQLHLNLVKALQERGTTAAEAEAAMVDAYVETDRRFLAQNRGSGVSCVTCTVTPSGRLVLAHAGDCRAVLCRRGKAMVLTEDHKASREDERERIEALGGHVDDFTGTWRVQGIMAVTRGIGDQGLKAYITPVPETRSVEIDEGEFLVMASDGLWDVVSPAEAAAVVSCALQQQPPAAAKIGGMGVGSLSTNLNSCLSPLVQAEQQQDGAFFDSSSSNSTISPAKALLGCGAGASTRGLSLGCSSPLSPSNNSRPHRQHRQQHEHQQRHSFDGSGFGQGQAVGSPSLQQLISESNPVHRFSPQFISPPPPTPSSRSHQGTRDHDPPMTGGAVEVCPVCCSFPGALESEGRMNKACKKLVELAVSKGSNDDICVMVLLPSALRKAATLLP